MTAPIQGLWHGPEADLVTIAGVDRVRFLNGYVTCDVKALAPGSGAYGFVTSAQGRVLADLAVLALPDRLVLETPAGRGPGVAAHLSRYVIADRVTIEAQPTRRAWTAIGGEAAAAAGIVSELLVAPVWSARSLGDGGDALALRRGRMGLDAWTAWSRDEPRATLHDQDLEEARIVAGYGRFGVDFDESHFPQETGAEAEAVSYTKGCYLGQEIVARIHYRGQAQRGLRRLRLEPGGREALGQALRFEEREVGRVTSASGSVGLAVLHRRAYEPGTRLEFDGGGAEVLPLSGDPDDQRLLG